MTRAPFAWLVAVATGFGRSVAFAACALIVPALAATLPVLAALRIFGTPWSWTNPWSWVGLLVIAAVLTLVCARLVGTLFRRLVARTTGIRIEDGYRSAATEPEPVRLATGYWWNGYSYERSRKDAVADQRWRRTIADPAYWRDVRWVPLAAVSVGPVCAIPAAALVGSVIALVHPTAPSITAGVILIVAAVGASPLAWRIVVPLAQRWLTLRPGDAMARRVHELEVQRAELTAAQSSEIRRIERDLHDGAQARLVAVGLSLATAERLMEDDPDRAKALLREARAGTSDSLAELRNLVRGVNPPVLVERGAVAAIRALALDTGMRVEVDAPDHISLEAPIEAAVYFSVAELLANAAKYARNAHAQVRIRHDGHVIQVEVSDDGPGGASIAQGGGLDGIRRRVAAFDGTLTLTSPTGGPTRALIAIPCASS